MNECRPDQEADLCEVPHGSGGYRGATTTTNGDGHRHLDELTRARWSLSVPRASADRARLRVRNPATRGGSCGHVTFCFWPC
jgi:hypothetical protein